MSSKEMVDKSIIWLASYPRSGNTFVRALLANYFLSHSSPMHINQLSMTLLGEHNNSLWKYLTTTVPEECPYELLWTKRKIYFDETRNIMPDRCKIVNIKSNNNRPLRIVKTHTNNIHPKLYNFQESDRIIFIVRNPLDVVISLTHYLNESEYRNICKRMIDPNFWTNTQMEFFEYLGTWASHTKNWLTETRCPILIIKYESLHFDTAFELERMIKFLDFTQIDNEKIKKSVNWSSFNEMKTQDDKDTFIESSHTKFFRNGKINQWKTELNLIDKHLILDHCKELMDYFSFDYK